MRTLRRAGFGLMELLLALVLLGMLASTLVVMVRTASRTAARAVQLLLAARAELSLQVFLQQELRDAMTGDVAMLSATRVGLTRPIGEASACADAGDVLLADATWVGTRTPEGHRDDAWLLVDPVAGTWLRLAIDSVYRDHCPDGTPATHLALAMHACAASAVRVAEPVELSAYPSGGFDWFGLTPASHGSPVQPFAGPLLSAATQFVRRADTLEIRLSPRGAAPTSLLVPLDDRP